MPERRRKSRYKIKGISTNNGINSDPTGRLRAAHIIAGYLKSFIGRTTKEFCPTTSKLIVS